MTSKSNKAEISFQKNEKKQTLSSFQRPKDSLLEKEVEFESAVFSIPISDDVNVEIMRYINMRFRERTFDNYKFEEIVEKIEEEEYDTTCCENSKELLKLFEEIDEELRLMVDHGNTGL